MLGYEITPRLPKKKHHKKSPVHYELKNEKKFKNLKIFKNVKTLKM